MRRLAIIIVTVTTRYRSVPHVPWTVFSVSVPEEPRCRALNSVLRTTSWLLRTLTTVCISIDCDKLVYYFPLFRCSFATGLVPFSLSQGII